MTHVSTNGLATGSLDQRIQRSTEILDEVGPLIAAVQQDSNVAMGEFEGNPYGAYERQLKMLPKGSYDKCSRRWMAACVACGPDQPHADMEWLIRRWISMYKAQVLRIDQSHPALRAWAWAVFARSVVSIGVAEPTQRVHRDQVFSRLHSYDPDAVYGPKSRTAHGFPKDQILQSAASRSSESSISSIDSEQEGDEVSPGPGGLDPPPATVTFRVEEASDGPPPGDGVRTRESSLNDSLLVDEVSGGGSRSSEEAQDRRRWEEATRARIEQEWSLSALAREKTVAAQEATIRELRAARVVHTFGSGGNLSAGSGPGPPGPGGDGEPIGPMSSLGSASVGGRTQCSVVVPRYVLHL